MARAIDAGIPKMRIEEAAARKQLEAFALDPDSALGIYHPDDLQAIRDVMRWVLKTQEPFSYRARVVRLDTGKIVALQHLGE